MKNRRPKGRRLRYYYLLSRFRMYGYSYKPHKAGLRKSALLDTVDITSIEFVPSPRIVVTIEVVVI